MHDSRGLESCEDQAPGLFLSDALPHGVWDVPSVCWEPTHQGIYIQACYCGGPEAVIWACSHQRKATGQMWRPGGLIRLLGVKWKHIRLKMKFSTWLIGRFEANYMASPCGRLYILRFMCMCVCVYVWVCICVCTHPCRWVRRPEADIKMSF